MTGHAIIIFVVGMIMIGAMVLIRVEGVSTDIVANSERIYTGQAAQNIAQSGVNMGLRQLSANRAWRTGFPIMNLLNGKVAVRAFDTTFAGEGVVAIRSTGIMSYQTKQETVVTSTAFVPIKFIPNNIKGAVTAETDVSVNGNQTIDGRDHTAAGVLIPNSGMAGVYTTKTFSASGSSQTGGTASGVDYTPTKPPNPAIVQQLQSWPNFPGTPDSVLGGASNGFPEGTLKAIAMSGAGGSQYSPDGSTLTNPLKGVTYVEGDFSGSMAGTGILIIHNSAKDAVYKNTSGDFTGILIVDDLVHDHSTVIGAVVVLTKNPSAGNVLGNGTGGIFFSKEALLNATDVLFNLTIGSNNTPRAWWE